MTVNELKTLLDAKQRYSLLDVREPWEFEFCHIDGSRNVPMSELPKQIGTLDKDEEFVVICHHGMRSLQVTYYLKNAGIEKVHNLDGGIAAWSATIDPDMPQY